MSLGLRQNGGSVQSSEIKSYAPTMRDAHLAMCLLVVVFVSVLVATGWQIWSARQRTLDEIDTHNRNLAQTLNTYAEGVLTQSSMLLLGMAERLEEEGITPALLQRMHKLGNRQEQLLNQLNELLVVDARGHWLMSSKGIFPAESSSADRSFFQLHRDSPSHDVSIGPPIRSRSTGEWVLTVSRRFENKQGQFGGVIVVTLGIENFLGLFGTIDVGKQGVISLATANGQLLVRYPFDEKNLGQDFSRSPNFLRYFSGLKSGTASFRSGIDGTERLYAFRSSDRYPFFTTVAQGKQEALHAWQRQAQLTAGVVFGLLAAIAVIGWRLIQTIRLRVHAEAALIAAREKLLEANRQLGQLAAQDSLTGLANRRHFDDTLELEARRSAREGTPLSLLLLDLDHFKGFNDSYGHVAGDECLKQVSRELKLITKRPGDLAARYGGEEMGIILPNTSLTGAMHMAQLLVQRIQGLGIDHQASHFGCVTCSIGVASQHGTQGLHKTVELIEAADSALYRAKAAGRNRAEC